MKNVKTPLVFYIEDDTIIFGKINFNLIINLLFEDNDVEYIKLYKHPSIDGHLDTFPRTKHKSNYLSLTYCWSNRPHIALTSHYFHRVFPTIPEDFKGFVETKIIPIEKEAKNNGR